MTLDEYAELERAGNVSVSRINGTWWRRVRPLFYQPLFPFQEIAPGSASPPRASILGGYQHLVPDGAFANSRRNFFVFDNDPFYCLAEIKHGKRTNIRKGARHFSVRLIDDIDEFVSTGHPVYLSFYERTGYTYRKERAMPVHFRIWGETLFRFPKVKILGAYCHGALAALSISYLVENVLIHATAFSSTEHMKLYPTDLLCHAMREKAAECPDISIILEGGISGKKSLDASKLQRGCKIITKPAFYRLNPVAEAVLKTWMRQDYRKVRGSGEIAGAVKEKNIRPAAAYSE